MPEISYTTTMGAPRTEVWAFVRDVNNWAPFARGYQAHEVVDDRESVWTVKGDLGPISRVTKVRVTITEWIEGEKVAFTVVGLNEPISGEGAIRLGDDAGGARTEIVGEGVLQFGGSLGPVVNHLIGPWVQEGADELVTRIVAAVTGEIIRPRRWWAILLANLWRTLTSPVRRLAALLARSFRRRPPA